jgi:WD40 repeat protein
MPHLIYLRKSRADAEAESRGEGETLARHKKTLFELAGRQNLSVTEVYAEVGSGETISARPEMKRLLSDVATGKCIRTLEMKTREHDGFIEPLNISTGYMHPVGSVGFGSDGKMALAWGIVRDKVIIWDIVTGKCISTLEGHANSVNSVCFSHDGKIALSKNESETKIWDVTTGKCIYSLAGMTNSYDTVWAR